MFLSATPPTSGTRRKHLTEILGLHDRALHRAGSIFFGAEYANQTARQRRRDIVQPCLCVYGTTTPLHFWNALQSANVVDGSLARFIILPTEDDYPEEALGRGIRTAPKRLVEQLRLVAAGGGHVPSGNLAGLGAGTSTAVEPMTVPMTPEASDALRRARRGRSRASCAKRGAPATPRCSRASARTPRSSR